MDTVVLRNITVLSRDPWEHLDSENLQIGAQLLMEEIVHDETERVSREDADLRWKLSDVFLVPVVFASFQIGIITTDAVGIRTHLGAVEIIVERIEPHASKQETHFSVQTSNEDDKDCLEISFTAYCSTSNLAKGPSPQTILSVVRSMDCEAIIALLTEIVISDTAFMNPDFGLLCVIHKALIKLPGERLHKPRALGLLANVHLARYDVFSKMMGEHAERYPMFIIYSKGIDKATSMLDAALSLASGDHPKRPWMILTLCMCLQRKLMQNSNESLFRATALKMSGVLRQMPDDEPKKPIFSNYLGETLEQCFTKDDIASDLDLSISFHEDAVRLTADDSPNKITFLVDLISILHNRVLFQQRADDTVQLLVLQEQLLSLTPVDFPGRLFLLKNLGRLFFDRFKDIGEREYIDKSVRMYEEALTLLPETDIDRPSILNNLAVSLLMDFQGSKSPQSLRKAINFVHQAIQLTPSNDLLRLQFITNLGNYVLALFEAESWDIDIFKMYNQIILDSIPLSHDDDEGLSTLMTNYEKFTTSVRFNGLSHVEVVEALTPLYRSAIDAFPGPVYSKASLLHNLGYSLFNAFGDGSMQDVLDHSIGLLEDSIRLCPEDSPKMVVWASTLSSMYLSRYIHFHEQNDWDKAECLSLAKLETLPRDLFDREVVLRNLASLHFQRFCRMDDIEFLHRSIEIYRDIFRNLGHESHRDTSRTLVEGSATLFRRFQILGVQEDIDEAISVQELALISPKKDMAKKAEIMSNLSKMLFFRFHRFHKLDDLDRAFAFVQDREVISASERSDVKASAYESYDHLSEYFQTFSGKMDVEECVKELELIVSQPPRPESILRVHNIGMFLSTRLPHSTILDVISKQTFESLQKVVLLLPDGSIDKGLWLSMLGGIALRMFTQSRLKDDLDRAVLLGEQAIQLRGDDKNWRKFLLVLNLASTLHQRFESSGEIGDLNRSINILEDACMTCPQGEPNQYRIFDALGISLVHRYDILGDVVDLNKASHALQQLEATVHAQEDAQRRYILQQNIGRLFQRRLKISGSRDDAQIAVDAIKISLQNLPEGGSEHLDSMVAYSKALLARFWHFRAVEDLDEATEMLESVLSRLPDDSQRRPGVLHELGSALAQRFVQHGEVDDIDRCVSLLKNAKDNMSEEDPGRHMLLFDIGRWLPVRYECLHDTKDLDDASDALRRASSFTSSPYMWRFRAASLRSYWTQAFLGNGGPAEINLEGYKDALALLPKIAWLGMPIQSRQWHLVEVGDVILDAAAAAVERSRYDLALEWLEMGRSVTWGQLIELRTPVNVLHDSHPVLAAKFAEISRALGEMETTQTASPPLLSTEHADFPTLPPPQRYHELADERERLLQHIRTLDGFENFLSPKSITELLEADFKGPVITININKFRCDALALMHDKQIVHIPLDKFSALEAHKMMNTLRSLLKSRDALRGNADRALKRSPFARRLNTNPEADFKKILSVLWICVAKPVLEAIGLTIAPEDPTTVLPRIWWCLTGPMLLLPIHAAGLYGSDQGAGSKSKLSDFAVSSYIPSLSALMRCSQPRPIHKKRLLAVALPIESALPCTQTEIEVLQKHDPIFPVACLMDSAATYGNVARELENAGWVHFACHGIQDKDDPTQSALLLSGNEKLTLSDISKLSLPHAELAFLSACQTATGDELLPEEAVHLVAGMLLAGYQGVVGTMWSIPDVQGPKVADGFYGKMLSGGSPDPSRAAHALHASIRALCENSDSRPSFFSWVPFVHYGL